MADLIARGLGKKANDEITNINTELDTTNTTLGNVKTELESARGVHTDLNTRLADVDTTLADMTTYVMFPRLTGETDDSPRLQRMINYAQDNGIGKVTLPARKFYCASPLRISRPLTFEGVYNSRDRTVDGGVGTIIYDQTNVNSNTSFITIKPTDDVVYLRGLHLNNINIVGNYHNHSAIYLERIASDAQINNVMIEKFNYEGLYLGKTDDINISNVFINDCGHSLDSNSLPRYALNIDGGDYPANALHFFGLHIEGAKYSLRLGRSFLVNFTNCKIEQDITPTNNDLNYSQVYVTQYATDAVFSDCQFISMGVNGWLNAFPNTPIVNIPYFMKIEDNLTYRQHVGINHCTFRSKGDFEDYIKAIDSTTRPVIINACSFSWLTDIVESIRIANSVLTNNIFQIKTSTQNANTSENMVNIGKGIRSDTSIISNNRFRLNTPTGIPTDIVINGSGNTITGNIINGFTNSAINQIKKKVSSKTRATNTAGIQSISLGFQPSYVRIHAIVKESISYDSIISFDGTSYSGIARYGNGTTINQITDSIIYLHSGGAENHATITITSTGFDLTWVVNGTIATGTIYMTIEAYE